MVMALLVLQRFAPGAVVVVRSRKFKSLLLIIKAMEHEAFVATIAAAAKAQQAIRAAVLAFDEDQVDFKRTRRSFPRTSYDDSTWGYNNFNYFFSPSSVVSVIKTHVVLVIAGSNPTRSPFRQTLDFRKILDLDKFQIQTNFRQKNRVSLDLTNCDSTLFIYVYVCDVVAVVIAVIVIGYLIGQILIF